MTLNLHLPAQDEMLKPTITVVGVGGAGGNAVNNMIASSLAGVDFVVANTDAQALEHSLSSHKIQLGGALTKGLGAGANPEIGRAATEEVQDEIARHIEGSNMVFITAGMGGGTGTGSAPVVARIAREMGVLTVAVVTKPFQFEGSHRMRLAEAGLKELQQYVDTLIIIPNQNLFRIANERTTFADAFKMADEVLHSGVRGVTDLMVKPGLINLDFADIRAVMQEMGKAMMGTGEATGERRAIEAAEAAISNPLLDDVSLKGAKSLLINITGGMDMTLFEVDEAANRIRQEVDPEANIIFGSAFNDDMEGRMRVSVVATGIDGVQQSMDLQGGNKVSEAKKPYLFAVQGRPEPVKINPRTAADVQREPQREQRAERPQPAAPMMPERRPIQRMEQAAEIKTASLEQLQAEEAASEAAALVMAKQILAEQKQQAAEVKQAEQQPVSRPSAPVFEKQELSAANISPRAEMLESLEPARELPNTRNMFQKIADVSKILSSSRPESDAKQEAREAKEHKREQREAREAKHHAAPLARAPEAHPQERSLQVKERKREKVKTPSLFDQEEQYIDIPAFLRRQAN